MKCKAFFNGFTVDCFKALGLLWLTFGRLVSLGLFVLFSKKCYIFSIKKFLGNTVFRRLVSTTVVKSHIPPKGVKGKYIKTA